MTRQQQVGILTVLTGVVILILLVVFLSDRGNGSSSSGATEVSVRLKWLHQAQFAGFYSAARAGHYEEEDLAVTINPGGVDFPAIQLVSSGSEQFGVAGADQVLLAVEKGVPVVAIAVLYQRNPVVFMSKSPLTDPRDFVNRRVGVKHGASVDLSYRVLMQRAGVDTDDIDEFPAKFDMTPLFTDQVEIWPGYIVNEPIVARDKGFNLEILWAADHGVNPYADTIFTTEEMIRTRPDVVLRFLRATLRGWEDALANREQAVNHILTFGDQLRSDLERAKLDASEGLLRPGDSPIGWMTRERWEETQEVLLDAEFLSEPLPLDKVFTMQFLRDIYGE